MKKILIICVALIAMLQAAETVQKAQPTDTVQKAKPAETFTLKAAGEPAIVATDMPNGMSFSGYEGKPVLLNFFGKDCPYCLRELPGLAAMKKKYGNRIGIIGVQVQDTMTKAERASLIKQTGINYPIYEYVDNSEFVQFVGSRSHFDGSIPFNIFFDAKGDVVGIIPGMVDEKKLAEIFADMLKK